MLPPRVNLRLRILATATVIALVLPAYSGFAPSPEGVESFSLGPFSTAAWRKRVGQLEETLRGNLIGLPVEEEAAHPAQTPLLSAEIGRAHV